MKFNWGAKARSRCSNHLRSVPVVLSTALARTHQGDDLVSRTIRQIVQRPDEITEVLAYYQVANKRTAVKKLNRVSKQVQKGLAEAFNQFDEYQFAKYNRDTEVKLRDALFLVHPKAKDEKQQLLFDKIANKDLATPYTWETELTALSIGGIPDLSFSYKKMAPGAKLCLFDLAGYGQAPLRVTESDVYLIAGWSDKIFAVLRAIEQGENALAMIKGIVL